MRDAQPIERTHLEELVRAVKRLEKITPSGRYADIAGRNLESALARLPKPVRRRVDRSIEKTVLYCFQFVLMAHTSRTGRPPRRRLGIALAGLSGGVGGAFGAAGLFIELPLITLLILRSIAEIARHSGEDLTTVEGRLACLEVLALGARASVREKAGYFATRAKLARLTGGAASLFVEQGIASVSSPVLARMLTEVLGRFGVAYSERTLIGSLPLVGAMASGAANALFMRYFQNLAVAHFTVRRLERQYDAVTIGRYYTAISAKLAKS
jgi:hypothetical protein